MFFDGLDEVTTENIPLAFKCFERVKAILSRVRLHVSTRPQFMQHLENSLGTLGYNIKPFTTSDQKTFLRDYWSKVNFELRLVPEKLVEYAERCLQTLKNTFTKEDKDFTGIPLQCLLLAELFENDAVEYADANNVKLIQCLQPTIQVKSISQLYQKIVDRKLHSFFTRAHIREHDRTKTESVLENLHFFISIQVIIPGSEWINQLRPILLDKQTHKHLRSILPNWNCTISDFQMGQLPRDSILAVGILEATDKTRWQFIHRTLAEYFVAQQASKLLNLHGSLDKKIFQVLTICREYCIGYHKCSK